MKRIVATILVCLPVAPPASAGETPGKPVSWEKAQKLKPGTEIVLTVTGGQPAKVRFLFADDTTLVTLKATGPKLPARVEEFLFDVGRKWRTIISGGGTYALETLRVTQDGVFDGDQKLAAFADVIQHTLRGNAQEVLDARHRHVLRNVLIVLGVAGVVVLLWATLGASG